MGIICIHGMEFSYIYCWRDQGASKKYFQDHVFLHQFVMCMYILLNYIFLYTVPIADMVGQVDVGYISGVVIFGNTGAMVIGIGISILLLSTVSSYVYIGPRIMQIMGEDHKLLSFLKK